MSNYQIGAEAQSIKTAPAFHPVSQVEVIVSDELAYYAGDKTGRRFSVYCPWGTQTIADDLLASVLGFEYQPFYVTQAVLNPAVEIGDALSLKGAYGGFYGMDLDFRGLYTPDLEAPEDEEIDHEYAFETKQDRQYRRELRGLSTTIKTQAGLIEAKVSQVGGAEDGSFTYEMRPTYVKYMANGSPVLTLSAGKSLFSGDIEAQNGYFHGTIYAGKIEYGGDAGDLNGDALKPETVGGTKIKPSSIKGGPGGHFVPATITGPDIAKLTIGGGKEGNLNLNTVSPGNVTFGGTLGQVHTNTDKLEGLGVQITAINSQLNGVTAATAITVSGNLSGNNLYAVTSFKCLGYWAKWTTLGGIPVLTHA